MEKRVLNESVFVREIVDIIRAGLPAVKSGEDFVIIIIMILRRVWNCSVRRKDSGFILCLETNGYQRLFPMSTMRMIILMNWELKNWQRLSMRWMRMMP